MKKIVGGGVAKKRLPVLIEFVQNFHKPDGFKIILKVLVLYFKFIFIEFNC